MVDSAGGSAERSELYGEPFVWKHSCWSPGTVLSTRWTAQVRHKSEPERSLLQQNTTDGARGWVPADRETADWHRQQTAASRELSYVEQPRYTTTSVNRWFLQSPRFIWVRSWDYRVIESLLYLSEPVSVLQHIATTLEIICYRKVS